MTTRPYTPGLPASIKRPCGGRVTGNGAVPEKKMYTREAVCRKDLTVD